MTFDRYFKTSSHCMIASGFLAIAATGGIDAPSILIYAAVLLASLWLNTAKLQRLIPIWALNCITLAYVVFFIFDYRFISQSFMTSTIHLLFFVSAIKLLTLARDSDYIQLYLISFAQVLAASTLTVNIVFAACLLIFLFCSISTLILFEMRRSNATMTGSARVRPFVTRKEYQGNALELFAPFPAGLFSITTAGIMLLTAILAIPFFFVFPRVTRGLYRQPSGHTKYVSGFSDRVELGQIGSIKQSDAIVMRVKTGGSPAELPPDLKWRGIAFDRFDGIAWHRTDRRQFPIPTQGHYYKLENSTQGTRWLNQTFFIEALPTNVVFAARKALAVSRDLGSLQKDFADSLYTDQHLSRKLRYSAISDPIRPNPALISDLLPVPPGILITYLQLPPEDPRIAELAKRITKTAPNRYAKAQALEQYLRSNYGYSLVLRGTPGGRDPLAMFLFEVRKGHCEYFASSMAIMLRQIGIPSRLVNGFRTGEYNGIGDNWIVRQYDAHSWVEAYVPPYGWIEFDPTPPEPIGSRSAFARFLSNFRDAIDLWWWEGIVNYDTAKQYGYISEAYARVEGGQRKIVESVSNLYSGILAGVQRIRPPYSWPAFGKDWLYWLPLIPAVAALLARRWRRKCLSWLKRACHPGNQRIAAASFFKEALAMLRDRGFKLDRGQTLMEFAQSLGDHPSRIPFSALTRMYYSVRFGSPGSRLNHAEIHQQLRLLHNSLQKASSKTPPHY